MTIFNDPQPAPPAPGISDDPPAADEAAAYADTLYANYDRRAFMQSASVSRWGSFSNGFLTEAVPTGLCRNVPPQRRSVRCPRPDVAMADSTEEICAFRWHWSNGHEQKNHSCGRPEGHHGSCLCFCGAWGGPPAEPQPSTDSTGTPWTERVTFGEDFALVVEMGEKVPYWYVLCPASATVLMNPPAEHEDPKTPDEHDACSISPECDFHELHALSHAAIRRRAAALVRSSQPGGGDA